MAYKLVVVREFHDRPHGRVLKPGEHIYHQEHVARLSDERERNCVRVAMTPDEEKQRAFVPAVSK